MYNKRAAGFTLIEMIMAIVIIGVGLAGLLTAFSTTVKASADPMVRKQLLSIAEEMMEEILLKPYAVGPGKISNCNRSAADDIADYGGYNQAVCDVDGTAVAALSAYRVTVTLAAGNLTSTGATPRSVPGTQIKVTVSYGGESISLVSWRTDYAS